LGPIHYIQWEPRTISLGSSGSSAYNFLSSSIGI
jgi:hypothetical protein